MCESNSLLNCGIRSVWTHLNFCECFALLLLAVLFFYYKMRSVFKLIFARDVTVESHLYGKWRLNLQFNLQSGTSVMGSRCHWQAWQNTNILLTIISCISYCYINYLFQCAPIIRQMILFVSFHITSHLFHISSLFAEYLRVTILKVTLLRAFWGCCCTHSRKLIWFIINQIKGTKTCQQRHYVHHLCRGCLGAYCAKQIVQFI